MIDAFDTNNGASTTPRHTAASTSTISFKQEPTADAVEQRPRINFGPVEDKTHNLIKVVGVGGGGCNAVRNMYNEGIVDVNFAVCNTDSKSLSKSPIPVKLPIGYLGAGGDPAEGRKAAQEHIEEIKHLFNDGTKMVFVTAGMGGGTGTGAAPVVAGVAHSMGLLTIGIVTIPFFFEKKRKIIKALKGVEEMRRNVDAILIVNNERICDIYSNSKVTIKEAFARADQILCNATKSISELITIEGEINLDFKDVESTMRSGGGAIMAMGRASGERRVEKAIVDALDSPLLYGNDISKAKRILFNIYTSEKCPLFVDEMDEVDSFMDSLNPDIDVIWGVSNDDTLDEDAKVTILATGFDDDFENSRFVQESRQHEDEYYSHLIAKLYKPLQKKTWSFVERAHNGSNAEDSSLPGTPTLTEADPQPDTTTLHDAEPLLEAEPQHKAEHQHEADSQFEAEFQHEAPTPYGPTLHDESIGMTSPEGATADKPYENTPESAQQRETDTVGFSESRTPTTPHKPTTIKPAVHNSTANNPAAHNPAANNPTAHNPAAHNPQQEKPSLLDRLKKKLEDLGLLEDFSNPTE